VGIQASRWFELCAGELVTGARIVRNEILALEEAIAGRGPVRTALMARIRAAVQAEAHAKAGEIRAECEVLEKQLNAHRAGVAKLLERLRELEGCDFAPRLTLPSAIGGDAGTALMAVMNTTVGPVTMRLQQELAQLRQKAQQIEAEALEACKGSQAAADSLQELLDRTAANTVARSSQSFAVLDDLKKIEGGPAGTAKRAGQGRPTDN
jgi:hypothetical protein